jgi:hypothetical protein
MPHLPPTSRAKTFTILAALTVLAFLIMGYHPGLEDDAFYLAAIKRNLNPSLFPHDAEFFRLQFQATIFDKLIALSVRLTHLPLAWAALLWQLAAIFLIVNGSWRISRRIFSQPSAQWAAVATIAMLLTLPISGTGINLADQYLHPRNLATAAILAAIVEVMDRRIWLAAILLAIAFAVHAIMASFGISFCLFLLWTLRQEDRKYRGTANVETVSAGALLLPLGWLFEPSSAAWRQAASTRGFYFLTHWHWYEWLGVFGPLIILYAVRHILGRSNATAGKFYSLLTALLYYGIFQTIAGLAIMLPPSFERLRPFEPMRYLHLLYLLFFLILGGVLGSYFLKHNVYRWLLVFVPLGAGMFYAQRQMFPATEHVEWPGQSSHNPWLQAFSWIRDNTPNDSLFALDPHYVALAGEDYHGFRALAERSVLADYDKDGGMAARVPRLAPRWLKEVTAQAGFQNFQAADFDRLKRDFGVTWVVVSNPQYHSSEAMTCPHENQGLRVCRLY